MAYEPTEWVCGDTVTADKLNKLERGVQEIMSDYVPTVWQCGEVITAEKLNKLEQAVADFECGSSDFSTAEVTIYQRAMLLSMLSTYDGMTVISASEPSDLGVYTVVLYNGKAAAQADPTASISGDIEHLGEGNFIITGNCTIGIQE